MVEVELGIRLREARESAKMSHVDVCYHLREAGVSSLYRWEKGKSFPGCERLAQMAKLYKRPLWWFLASDEELDRMKETIGVDAVNALTVVEQLNFSNPRNETFTDCQPPKSPSRPRANRFSLGAVQDLVTTCEGASLMAMDRF